MNVEVAGREFEPGHCPSQPVGHPGHQSPSPSSALDGLRTDVSHDAASVAFRAGRHSYTPRVLRVSLFLATGLVWCAISLRAVLDPTYQVPPVPGDWFSVLSFSAAIFALAIALPVLAQTLGDGRVVSASLVGAAGAAAAGVANIVEDGLRIEWAFFVFIGGALVLEIGLLAMAALILIRVRGRLRFLAAVPVVMLLDVLLLHEFGGGVLVLAAWLLAAASTVTTPGKAAPVLGIADD